MENKIAFLKLWKWAKWYFRMRWFRHKNIDAFLKEGELECDEGKRYMMRKCYETLENDGKVIVEYWIKIDFYVLKRPYFPMSDKKFKKLSKKYG